MTISPPNSRILVFPGFVSQAFKLPARRVDGKCVSFPRTDYLKRAESPSRVIYTVTARRFDVNIPKVIPSSKATSLDNMPSGVVSEVSFHSLATPTPLLDLGRASENSAPASSCASANVGVLLQRKCQDRGTHWPLAAPKAWHIRFCAGINAWLSRARQPPLSLLLTMQGSKHDPFQCLPMPYLTRVRKLSLTMPLDVHKEQNPGLIAMRAICNTPSDCPGNHCP
jgi:hypothetical protein